jgi:hypothetical protein
MYGTEQLKVRCDFLQNENFVGIMLVLLLFSSITSGTLLQSKTLSLREKHLVRCLTHISLRYFTPGRSLVISSPSTYRDVQQELVAEIHRNSIWPVVTVDGNITKHKEREVIDRNGSYIILIPDGDFKSFQVQINGLIQEGKYNFRRLWNSETRFVVAGANMYSKLHQTAIFDYFSQLRIYNCIIVSQLHDVMDIDHSKQTNVNDVDADMKLGLYTWFPYQTSNHCTEVKDTTLLDSWVFSAQGNFTNNTDLFPIKIRNSFNGCPMKAVVRNGYGFIETYYLKDKVSSESDIYGLEMNLLRIILKQMNMTFVYVPTPEGFETEGGSVNNLVTAMNAKEAYIALGSVTRNLLYYTSFDLTNSYFTTRFRWYVPCPVKYPRWSSFFRILSGELWIVLIISIVFAAISATLCGRYSCTSEWQGYKTLTSSLTYVWAVILGVSVSTMPRTPSLRSLFLAWVCFSLAFSTVFQVFLTSFLINSGYKPPIQNMDELFSSDIKLAFHPYISAILEIGDETEVLKLRRHLTNCPSYFVCKDWAMYQKNVSILIPDIYAEYFYAIGDMVGENSKPLLCGLKDGVVFPASLTMMMFHGDPLTRRVNDIIDRVIEAGLYNYWITLEFNWRKIVYGKIFVADLLDGYYSFNIYHLQTVFHLLLMDWCLSALCFILEVFYNRVLSKIM